MAVSFKVPKSPKKSIFAIEDFLGVDLSNTGTSIDDVRSPNAENMVRWTPGKVRKRTGYQTKMLFATSRDINRAKDTSDEWVDLFEDGGADYVLELYGEALNEYSLYLEAEAVGNYDIITHYADGTEDTDTIETGILSLFEQDASEHDGVQYFVIHRNPSTAESQHFNIKNMRICATTSASDQEQWNELSWEAAPEDKEQIYTETEDDNNPIYGIHTLKTGVVSGSRVVNVNRVLDTAGEHTWNVTTSIKAFDLAECFYKDEKEYPNGIDIYVDFDYKATGNGADMIINGQTYSDYTSLQPTTEYVHKEFVVKNGGYLTDAIIYLRPKNGASTVYIKNMSVMYEKDEEYTWSAAPEDNNLTFHLEDIYSSNGYNYAYRTSYTHSEDLQRRYAGYYDLINNTGKPGYTRIQFDLSVVAENIYTVHVSAVDNNGAGAGKLYYVNSETFNKHFDLIVSGRDASRYIDRINIDLDSGSSSYVLGQTDIEVSNIVVNYITPKKDYGVSSATYIYHTGGRFYARESNNKECSLIYSNANKRRSQSFQINDELILIDGQEIYSYKNGSTVEKISINAYIPLITIGKSPSGGGTAYEPLNMLQPAFYEQFTVDSASATATEFQLSFDNLSHNRLVQVWVLDNRGIWQLKTEFTDYTVNYLTGVITFVTAPGVTPIEGEDNVRVLASKEIKGYRHRVTKCRFGTLFGVGGEADRLFLSGNPDYPNWDFYSQQNDPTYFPDTGYSIIGSKKSAVIGYASLNNYLVTFKDELDNINSAYVRQGDLVTNEYTGLTDPVFRIVNILQGNSVVAPYSFGNLQTEPLFLTRSGVFAITVQDLTGEKYSQNRSFYLNGALTKEKDLENAIAVVYKDQYILAINNKFYILDGLQATRTDRSEPYSTRQYAGFFCTNIPAFSMWVDEQALWIGTSDGRICRFNTDVDDCGSYNDDGRAIYACWETPDLDGNLFYKNKTFRYFAIRLKSTWRSSYKLWAEKLGNWNLVKEDKATTTYFDFEHINFSWFSFSTDRSNRVGHTKLRVKKVDKARFRIENGNVNEPLGLVDLALEYIESGNYKG